ncbi:MAG: hypothetical protein QNJ57_08065 [Flavobacteriaceae bacterium]|nr:hypothetical protein [Flavobacteriaceae bacterium]
MTINHIVTPLDSAELDSKEHYVFYHRMVDFALKELIVKMQQNNLCDDQEIVVFKQYIDLLLYSIEAMRIKYMYDEEDNMKIDLTYSGFPNYLEFRYLFNDLALKDNYIHKLTSVDELRKEFLDELLRNKPISREKLFQAASIIYYTSVEQNYIFKRFVQGKIITTKEGNDQQYMTSWSFFDVGHNRPFICYMYFDYNGRNIEKYKTKIYEVLKAVADREMALDTMAYTIDRRLPDLWPKYIKRIDLGPFHNVFAKDENEITHTILESIAKKEISLESYALALKIDEVRSVATFKDGGFFTNQILQKWGRVVKNDYILAPHRSIQLLYNKLPDKIAQLTKPPIQLADLVIDKI